MTDPVRILLLEDDACDAELVQRELRRAALECTVRWIADRSAFVAALDQFTPDLILADYSLPGFDGLTALSLARQRFPDIPGIIVSGAIGEETAIDVLKGGATDYVLKQRLSRLGLVVRRALQEAEQLAGKRRAEEALRATEFRYRTVADNTYDFEFWLDPEGRCLYASPAFQRIYGRDVAEFVADPTLRTRVIHPDDREVFERHAVEEEAKHALGEIEYRVMWPDGTYRWVSHACRPIFDDDGRYLGVRGCNRDITERKQAEEALRESEERLRTAIAGSQGAEWQIPADEKQEYAFGDAADLNPGCKRFIGFADDEFPNSVSAWRQRIHPDDLPAITTAARAHIEKRTPFYNVEYRIRHKDGTWRHLLSTGRLQRDSHGRPLQWTGLDWDITERKRAEEALREAKEQLETRVEERTAELHAAARYARGLIEASVDPLVTISPEGKITDVNQATEAVTGVGRDRLIGSDFSGYFAEPDKADAGYRQVLAQGEVRDYPLTIRHVSGRTTDVLYNATLYRNEAGQMQGVFAAARDVTARKRAEAAAQAERQRLFDVLETLPAMVCLLTPDYHVAFANRSFRTKFGEANGRRCHEYCYGRGEPCEFCESYNVLKTGKPHRWEVTAPDGTVVDAHDFPFTDVDGSPLILEMDVDITEFRKTQAALKEVNETLEQRVAERTAELQAANASLNDSRRAALNLMEDAVAARQAAEKAARKLREEIVERKQAEEALRESELFLKESQRIARVGSWKANPRTGFAEWSDEVFEILEMPRDHQPGLSEGVQFYLPEHRPVLTERLERCLATGEGFALECQVMTATGKRLWAEVRGLAPVVEGGRSYVMGTFQDISERRRAEEALRRSEAMLARAERIANVGGWEWDLQTGQVTWSEQMYRTFNVNSAEFVPTYERFLALVSSEDRQRVVEAAEKAIAAGEPYDIEYRIPTSDAAPRHVHARAELLCDQTGRAIRMTGTVLDITDRKAAEERIRSSEKLYRAIGESINYGIWVCAPDGRNTYASESFLKLVGLTQEQCSSFGWGDVLHPDDSERTIAAWKECTRTGGTWDIEHRFRGVDGKWHAVLARGVPVRNDRGEITCWAGINLDIDRLKRTEEELRSTATELARSNRELEQFAYVASHDLQEPLRMVSSYMSLLKRRYGGKLDAAADEFIDFAVDGATRMSNLISDLLAYSRVSKAGEELRPTDCDEAVQHVLDHLQFAIEDNHAVVTRDRLPTVRGDQTQLMQLFQNLISNALKFRREEPPRIHVGVRDRNGMWEFSVADNGIGMSRQHHERAFLMFQRLHTRDQYPGTGIGLAICKRIVDRHGGEIWVESQPGQGSTFHFTLPKAAT